MHKLFTVHMVSVISVHSCRFPQPVSNCEEMDSTICDLFYNIAYLENQVSNILRHSQLKSTSS